MERSSTLVEVVAAILPLLDKFPALRWSKSLTGEDFVEHWFPFVADFVQNGMYDPPVEEFVRASGTPPRTPQTPQTPGTSQSNRSRSPSPQRKTHSSPADEGGVNGTQPIATHSRAGEPLDSSVVLAGVAVLRKFTPLSSFVLFKLRLLESDVEEIANNLSSSIKRRESLHPVQMLGKATGAKIVRAKSPIALDSLMTSSHAKHRTSSPFTVGDFVSGVRSPSVHFNDGDDTTNDVNDLSLETKSKKNTRKRTAAGFTSTPRCNQPLESSSNCLMSDATLKRRKLMLEIQRIMSTPRGRRPGFADGYFATFLQLRNFVEVLLSAVFSAADTSEADRLTWLDFESFLTDSAIAYNNQLSLRDLPIFVEDSSSTVAGAITFARITTGSGDAGGTTSGRASGSRMILTVLQGIAAPQIKVLPLQSIDPNVRTTSLTSPSTTIKAAEFLEDAMCFVCCSDRAVHFYDFRFGANCQEITSFSLDVLMDSPSALIWLPEFNVFLVGGISGYLWKFTPPVWSSAKREWKPPVLTHCRHRQHMPDAGAAAEGVSPVLITNQQTGPIFRDAVGIIRRAYQPNLVFISSKSTVSVYDVLSDTICLSHAAHEGSHGMHHVSGLVFNASTSYLLCSGEALYLLLWLSPNLSNQTPVKLEDIIAPHTGHIVGLETHPSAAIVVSLDFHGAVKIWDLNAMSCIQNILLTIPRAVDSNRLHLRFFGRSLCTIVANRITLFKVDDETIEASPSVVLAHPRGGSFTFAVNRDVIQLSSSEGKKELHHQNLCDVDIMNACFVGVSFLAVLDTLGNVAFHSLSSGKSIASFGRKLLRAEGVDVAYCSDSRRVVVPTASPWVWFLSSDVGGKEHRPIMGALDPQDGAATCVSVGHCEKRPLYCVGTVENSVNIFRIVSSTVVKLLHRIPPPPPLAGSGVDDSSAGATGSDPDVVTCLLLSMRVLVVCDSAGRIRAHRSGTWSLQVCCNLYELGLSAGGDLSSITSQQRADFLLSIDGGGAASSSGAKPTKPHASRRIPKALCVRHYKDDSVIAVGDSSGCISFIDITKNLELLHSWKAHEDGGCNSIAVEKEVIATVGESASLFIWTSSGDFLGNVWGRSCCPPETIPTDLPAPLWLAGRSLIGRSSLQLSKKASKSRGLGKVVSIVSSVARLARLSRVFPENASDTADSPNTSIRRTRKTTQVEFNFELEESTCRLSLDSSMISQTPSFRSRHNSDVATPLAPTQLTEDDPLEVATPRPHTPEDSGSDDNLSDDGFFRAPQWTVGKKDIKVSAAGGSKTQQITDHVEAPDLPSNLRPIAWKAHQVTSLDDAFRVMLGQQRVLSCSSQVLGQPNTMHHHHHRKHQGHGDDKHDDSFQEVSQMSRTFEAPATSKSATYSPHSKPRYNIVLTRSGNVVGGAQKKRSTSSLS